MRIRILILAFLFISFFSCELSEEPLIEDPVAEDEKNPELSVTGLTDVIETNTEISISIIDESTVETKVMHDGAELASSTEKQFDFPINPYVIPVGATDFVVISKDAKGNEISETFTVEIRHLLITYEIGLDEIDENRPTWIFLNKGNGAEIAAIEGTAGVHKIYTDEIISEDKMLFSWAGSFTYGQGSFKDVFVDTYEVPLGGNRLPKDVFENIQFENTVEVQLNGVPFENGLSQYVAHGSNYSSTNYSGDTSSTMLTIGHDANRPIYIRRGSWGSNPVFDGKKENYFYTIITPLEGNTTMSLELNTLIHAENNKRLEIPTHDAGSLHVNRIGSENEQDHMDYRNHRIYDVSETNDTTVDYLDLPFVSGLKIYDNSLSYSRNGVNFYSRGNDSSLDTQMPNWTASVQVNDTLIDLTAINQEVDSYSVNFSKSENAPDYSSNYRLNWNYHVFNDDNGTKQFLLLSLPEIITEALVVPFYQTTDDLVWYNLQAWDYEKYNSYDEVVAGFALNQNIITPFDNESRQVTFWNPDFSFKSSKTISKNLDRINRKRLKKYSEEWPNHEDFNALWQY